LKIFRVVVATSLAVVVSALGQASGQELGGQEMYTHGRNVAVAYEGWEKNPDGSFNLVFGYFNRNWVEQPVVPIGPDNNVEPGGSDQGQPTRFFPRRNRFVFRVRVPSDFGKKEVVWTLTVHGKTERAYATLHPDYILESQILQRNYAGLTPPGMHQNTPPVVTVEGAHNRVVKAGEPLTLVASVRDDGIPKPRATTKPIQGSEPGYHPALGLRASWFVYRGHPEKVTFEPEQFKVYPDYKNNSPWTPGWVPPPFPADGKFPVKVTFGEPGTYVLQVLAHDGGFGVTESVNVTVNP
jgi:hypothetical protein